jgi:hypothetical protein
VLVLVEDIAHQSFVRRYLYRMGYQRHDLQFEPLANGRGAGEQRVRNEYAPLVKAYRGRHARSALVVAIDADTQTVGYRLQQLAQALEQAGERPRGADEPIALLVPKPNIERWILCLIGETVDEDIDTCYPADVSDRIRDAAAVFHSWSRPNTEPPHRCIPSLRAAIPEIRRLDP